VTRRAPLLVVLVLGALGLAAGPAQAAGGWYRFAPYVDQVSYPPPSLTSIKAASGVRAATLGFVTARGKSCTPTWGGYREYPAAGRRPYRLSDVRGFRRAGGGVVVSFGGAGNTELATVCPSVRKLTRAYRAVIRAYGVDHVDFDIEGAATGNHAADGRRNKAIAALQRAARRKHHRLRVAFTLPVGPSGLEEAGKSLLRSARRNHVSVDLVNVMAMDYYDAAPNPAGNMGNYAIQAGTSTRGELQGIFGWSAARATGRLGVTPMIGINDAADEVFDLPDAGQLVAWANSQGVAMLSMWELRRDSQCAQPVATTQINCSGVAQDPWAFAHALAR
jgi:hypothetical protein